MGIDELLKHKREQILSIAHAHGALRVKVFGSLARGEATEASDIDLLVDLKKGASLLDIVAIKQDIEDLLGRKVEVVTSSSISPYIREAVLKEAVNL